MWLLDITNYEARLENICYKLEDFEDIVTHLVLDESDQSDKVRIESIDTAKEILANETKVKEKIKELLHPTIE